MTNGDVTNNWARRRVLALFTLLVALSPSVTAQNVTLRSLLRQAEQRAQIQRLEDSLDLVRMKQTAREQQVQAGKSKAAADELAIYQGRQAYKTTKELSNLLADPNVIGNIVKIMTDPAIRKGLQPLSPQDADGPWLGGPQVPAGCAVAGAECGVCFSRAQTDLDTVRRRFDRVNKIYRAGIAHMKALISLGESARNVNPYANMATRKQAAELEADADRVRASYDKAYDRLLIQLKTALDGVSECEDRAFGNDWYNRYGFVLYQSFAMHYKRVD